MHRYFKPLFEKTENGEVGPSIVVTSVMHLREAPQAYEMFKKKLDGWIKVVLKPA